ncbi:MAG: histidine--tRNA ligase [Clostridia bacterium]|nr:histidine--tRNA ligase [Clostridia bacterium]MDY2713987.1 histidine--tRNA ligase [Christensenellaceae bacterium]MDY3723817.1 histidine--tRNA ligase [Christensenellaceae bacterium]
MINIPKGTKDVLPFESYKWHYVENTVKKIASDYCLNEIRTPVFEHTELFLRGVGETTDVVNKEMYTFLDKGERSITLKPEGTAGVARSFIENGLFNGAMPLKTYYISPVFRYENPQKGRLREHHQFGVEIYGGSGADVDAEVIKLAHSVLTALGLKVKLHINSMGCKECRKKYNEALRAYFADKLDKLCATCRERYVKNPLRILDCKSEECKALCVDAPKITDYLCDDCSAHFEKLKKFLEIAGIEYEVDPYIVRGLDYYTKTVFEFVTTALGSQGTVCGGGRYDDLIAQLGGEPTCGVGFGMGIERVLMLMEAQGVEIPKEDPVKIFIATMGEAAYEKAFGVVCALRDKGVKAELEHAGRGIKAQFKYADKIGAEYVATIGENELASGVCRVKKMSDGSQTEVKIDELKNFLL